MVKYGDAALAKIKVVLLLQIQSSNSEKRASFFGRPTRKFTLSS